MLESQQLFKFDVHTDTEQLTDVLRKLAGAKSTTITKEGKVRFSGHVEIELDFNKQIKSFLISDIKTL